MEFGSKPKYGFSIESLYIDLLSLKLLRQIYFSVKYILFKSLFSIFFWLRMIIFFFVFLIFFHNLKYLIFILFIILYNQFPNSIYQIFLASDFRWMFQHFFTHITFFLITVFNFDMDCIFLKTIDLTKNFNEKILSFYCKFFLKKNERISIKKN
jgi:hypothetical protein